MAPPGIHCRVAGSSSVVAGPGGTNQPGNPEDSALLVTAPGVHRVACRDARGQEIGSAELEITGVEVAATAGGAATLAPLPRNTTSVVELAVTAGDVELPELAVRAPRGITIASQGWQGNGRLAVAVTPTDDAPDRVELIVIPVGDEGHPGLARIIVAIAPRVTVEDRADATLPVVLPRDRRLTLGLLGGLAVRSREYALGMTASDARVGNAILLGLRAGYAVHARIRLEAEFTGARTVLPDDMLGGTLLGYHAHVLVPILAHGQTRPFALVGAGGHTFRSASSLLADDTTGEVYYGLGASLAATELLGLRLDLRHVLASGRDRTIANNIEFQIGVSWSL